MIARCWRISRQTVGYVVEFIEATCSRQETIPDNVEDARSLIDGLAHRKVSAQDGEFPEAFSVESLLCQHVWWSDVYIRGCSLSVLLSDGVNASSDALCC